MPMPSRAPQKRISTLLTETVTAARTGGATAPRALPRRVWDALGAPVSERQVPGTVVVATLAAVLGFMACLYTTGQGTNLDYSDAQSHLNIARRIFDSRSPGFEQ